MFLVLKNNNRHNKNGTIVYDSTVLTEVYFQKG